MAAHILGRYPTLIKTPGFAVRKGGVFLSDDTPYNPAQSFPDIHMSTIQQITVNVTPQYLREQSDPDANQYVFAYTVHMENTGNIPAKLLSRHWIITDADGETREVRGPGVVGEHPHLQPGERYEYTSGAILPTPVGSMMGSYQMQDDSGDLFDASIPAFTLAAEVVFH